MLLYVTEALRNFHHTMPRKPQDQPHSHAKPNYGQKVYVLNSSYQKIVWTVYACMHAPLSKDPLQGCARHASEGWQAIEVADHIRGSAH